MLLLCIVISLLCIGNITLFTHNSKKANLNWKKKRKIFSLCAEEVQLQWSESTSSLYIQSDTMRKICFCTNSLWTLLQTVCQVKRKLRATCGRKGNISERHYCQCSCCYIITIFNFNPGNITVNTCKRSYS